MTLDGEPDDGIDVAGALWSGLRPNRADGSRAPVLRARGRGALLTALAEEGVAVVVVERRRRGWLTMTPLRLTSQLAAAGFRVDHAWLVAPGSARPRRAVPLDHDGAFRWYVRTLFVPGTLSTTLASSALRALLWVGGVRLVAALSPTYAALVRTADEPPTTPAALAPLDLDSPGPNPPKVLVLGSGNDTGSRLVLLTFDPAEVSPSTVIKVAADAVAQDSSAEHGRLIQLRSSLPAPLAETLPLPLRLAEWDGHVWTAQTAAAGEPVDRSSATIGGRVRARRDLRRTKEWAIAFAQATTRDRVTWNPGLTRSLLIEPAAKVAATQRDRGIEVLLPHLERLGADAEGKVVPMVVQHFDLAPCNVFLTDRTITVLDWELSSERAPVGIFGPDLLFFTTYWLFMRARARDNADRVDLVRALLEPGRPLPARLGPRRVDEARRALWGAFDALEVDRALLPLVHARLWVERALHHGQRSALLGRPPGSEVREVEDALRYLATIAETPVDHVSVGR